MAGVRFDTVTGNKVVGIGDNRFEQGTITLAAGADVAAGTALKRAGAKFAPAEDGDTFVAVMPFDLKNDGEASADLGFRAIVGGDVRKDALTVGGAPITAAQADALRGYGIFAVPVTDLSRVNP
ncbi:MAG: hypothetical protein LBE74_06800 [Treponema sp.]|jgi:hypothetical protein|nr:hypothetical protein [Treponema sp.]